MSLGIDSYNGILQLDYSLVLWLARNPLPVETRVIIIPNIHKHHKLLIFLLENGGKRQRRMDCFMQ